MPSELDAAFPMNLSVVIPTLNCSELLGKHIESLSAWSDLAGEIIVVDSHSDDGTVELIRERLKHPNLKILSHPRGLYQSWNHAIQQTEGRWVYISTAGDTIGRDQITHLITCGETCAADVVCSPPIFESSDSPSLPIHEWPITRILADTGLKEPVCLSSLYLFAHALLQVPRSILGSSASNLYRGNHIRTRPFPLGFGVCGDTAWPLKYAFETRFCFTPRAGSIFLFHEKVEQPFDNERAEEHYSSIRSVGLETIRSQGSETMGADIADLFSRFIAHQNTLPIDPVARARANFRKAKEASIFPWFMTSNGWKYRREKKEAIDKYRHGVAKSELHLEIEKLLQTGLISPNPYLQSEAPSLTPM